MYCRECGKQIPDDSVFCRYCGKNVDTHKESKIEQQYDVSNDQILFTFKPEFHGGYVILKLIPLFIFFSIFFSILITIIRAFLSITGIFNTTPRSYYSQILGVVEDVSNSPFDNIFQFNNIFIGIIIAFMLIIVFGYHITKKHYANSIYQFYTDRMEYIDGYFNYSKKQIFYKNIQELSMSQNVYQRKYNIGSIRLTTSGITYHDRRAYGNGIRINDLANINNVYSELKKLIK